MNYKKDTQNYFASYLLVIIIVFLGFKIYTGKIGNKVKYDNGHFGIATYQQ